MPIAITGMPRGGVAFVASLLHERGIILPDGSAAGVGRPGLSLTAINERLLARFGGGWDTLPRPAPGWETSPLTESLRSLAGECVTAMPRHAAWAWSDPATLLALPFWRDAIEDLGIIVVIRNPLEVLASLRAASGCSLPRAITLVRGYLAAARAAAGEKRTVVTHFAAHAIDAAAETSRVLDSLGLRDLATAQPSALRGYSPCLRHSRFTVEHLDGFGMPADIVESYAMLCDRAGFADRDPDAAVVAAPDVIAWLRDGLRETGGVEPCGDDEPYSGGTLAGGPLAVGTLAVGTLAGGELATGLRGLQNDLARLRAEIAARDEAFEELLEDVRFAHSLVSVPPARLLYRQVVRRARKLVRDFVPAEAVVAIISKGDDDLLRHRQVTAWHFPRTEEGSYAGCYPACDLAAIAHLETLRSRGATHLLVPETYDWWLTSYPGFHNHLEQRHRRLERRPGAGVLYELLPEPAMDPDGDMAAAAVRRLAAALGRPAQVLDITGDPATAKLFADATRLESPVPTAGEPLPYIDTSVDVVAVAAADAEVRAEARRVAAYAVVDVAGEPAVEWISPLPTRSLPSASIVIPVFNQWPVTRGCLSALRATLSRDHDVEIIVVDDASTDDTPIGLAALARVEPRLKVLRNDANLGFVGSCNRAAATSTRDILVFLNNDTVPLPGWLEALLGTFGDLPRAGAVGGKLLFPDGRLQEAGGIVFSDASACHFGRNEPNASQPPFDQPRQVDYVSGALLATPRRLFEQLGGFDPEFAPGYYEDTDYCFRLRELNRTVWFQPDAVVVHVEGATAGTDLAVGMKRYQVVNLDRFRRRHARALREQPSPEARKLAPQWDLLARRGAGRVTP
jgi:GT2 family glycosyltransferase